MDEEAPSTDQGVATQGESHLEFWMERLTAPSFVYVVQGDEGTPVKIGTSRDPKKRLRSLQTAAWQELRLLHVLPGDRHLERSFHEQLADCRVRLEWYDGPNVPRFLEYVGNLAERMVAEPATDGIAPSVHPHDPDRLEDAELRDFRWRQIADRWLAGCPSDMIAYEVGISDAQLAADLVRMRSEGGYDLPQSFVRPVYSPLVPGPRPMGGWTSLAQPKRKHRPAPVTTRRVEPAPVKPLSPEEAREAMFQNLTPAEYRRRHAA